MNVSLFDRRTSGLFSFLLALLGTLSAPSRAGAAQIAVFDNHVVSIHSSGFCLETDEKTNIINSSSTTIDLDVTSAAEECLGGTISFKGKVTLAFPQNSPPGDIGVLNTITFATPLTTVITLEGDVTITRTPPNNTYSVNSEAGPDVPGRICPTMDGRHGPGLAAGTYHISLTAPCDRTFITFPTENNGVLTYFVRSFANLSVFEPKLPAGLRVLFGVFVEATTRYKVNAPSQVQLNLDPSTLSFDSTVGRNNPPPQTVVLSNPGGSGLDWEATVTTTDGDRWLTIDQTSGHLDANGSTSLSVTVDSSRLFSDEYHGSIKFTSPDASNSPQELKVDLLVNCPAEGLQLQSPGRTILCSDILTLTEESPRGGGKTQAELKASGLRAKITYGMVSRKQALLFLRVFDQDGNLVGSSSVRELTRPDPFPEPAPPAQSETFEIPGGSLTFQPTSRILRMYALYIDPRGSTVFKRSREVLYYLGRLEITPPAKVYAGDEAPLEVKALREDGGVDALLNGTIKASLAAGGTEKIAVLKTETEEGLSVSAPLNQGQIKTGLILRPPEKRLDNNTPITPETVLDGKAMVQVEFEAIPGLLAQKEVKVDSPLDLQIDRIELQQGVNDSLANQNPMIQDKALLVRVFVTSPRFNGFSWIEGIGVKLTVKDERGAEVDGSPFSMKTTGPLTAPFKLFGDPAKFDRSKGEDSLNQIIYPQARQLSFEASLDHPYKEFPEEDPNQDSATIGPVNVAPTKSIKIIYASAQLNGRLGTTAEPSNSGIAKSILFAQHAYPLPEANFRFVPAPAVVLTEDPFDIVSKFDQFQTGIWLWWNRARGASADARVWFVNNEYFEKVGKLGTTGETLSGLSIVNSESCSGTDACGYLARELGHSFGLRDGGTSGEGWSVLDGSFNFFENAFALRDGAPYRDFLGNRSRTWVAPLTWEKLRTRFVTSGTGLQGLSPAGEFVIVEGLVFQDGSAKLADCYVLTGTGLASSSAGGTYAIETLDANSAVLSRLDFTPDFQPPNSASVTNSAPFSFALPFSPAVRRIQIRKETLALDDRSVSTNAPTVRFDSDFAGQTLIGLREVRWSGSDGDGDAIRYSLFYSPDGELQIPLLEGGSGTNYSWNTDEAPSGSAPRLTLVATDGVLTATAESAPFIMPNRPPSIVILSPEDGSRFGPGDLIELRGGILDAEDGAISTATLTWSSDKQGLLGSGSMLGITNLVEGAHLITVSGADSEGTNSSSSIHVLVANPSTNTAVVLSAALQGNEIRLSWPASAVGFALQSAASLSPPVGWQPVGATVTNSGDETSVSLPISGQIRFYRLVKP